MVGADGLVTDGDVATGTTPACVAIADERERLGLAFDMDFWNLRTRLEGILPKAHHRVDRLGHHAPDLGLWRLGVRLGHRLHRRTVSP